MNAQRYPAHLHFAKPHTGTFCLKPPPSTHWHLSQQHIAGSSAFGTGKHPFFSTKSGFSSIRTEKRPFPVRIRAWTYTTRSQTSPKHTSSTSTNHSLMIPAVSSFPDVTRQEQNHRRMPFFFPTLHVRKTGIGHRDHRQRQNRGWKCHRGIRIEG